MSNVPIPADHDHDVIGKDAYYLSRQMADLRSDIRSWQQETNARIDSTNARIDSTNARIDSNQKETNARIDSVSKQLIALLIAGLVAAVGIIGALIGGFVTVLQRLL